MNIPRVTVISPYYRRAHAVEETLESIARQTFTDFKAYIWDDCSPDGTWEEIQRVSAKLDDQRFVIFRNQTNIGLTLGLNNALHMCESEYIAVVGSGDICHPRRLEAQVRALDEDVGAVFCATNSRTLDPVSGRYFADSSFSRSRIERGDLIRKVPFTHGSVMFRKAALERVGFYEPTFTWCADWDLFLRLLALGHASFIDDVLYERVAQVEGVSFDPEKSMIQIQCRYLVYLLAGASSDERHRILDAARQDIDALLSGSSRELSRDLWKRQIKLALMGRKDQARRLRSMIREKYGMSLLQDAGYALAYMLGWMPIDTDFLVNAARKFSSLVSRKT